MISIQGLKNLMDALARIDISAAQREGTGNAASQIEIAVKESLCHPPGSDHSTPWLRSGALRNSIAHSADEAGAAIGSSDPVAVYQELGTRTVSPRPFLAPAAATQAEESAQAVATTVVDAIRGALK